MADEQDGMWFAAKRYGYGSGPPIAWQGWALMAALIGAVGLCTILLMPAHPALYFATIIVLTIGFSLVAKRRTRGGWHWRWGK